jgi:acetyl/propionyl-CoA carboxylase alpha subunit
MARVDHSLVANRRAIAIRIIRACRELGIPTATIYTV